MRNLLLTALLATCVSASAADQAQPYVKKFDVPTPDALPAKRADVQMPLLVKGEPVPAAAAAPAATTGAATAPSGLPMIPASDPTNKATVPAATSTAGAPSTGTPVAGQPVTTYATMAQAAKAGVDPLNEQKSSPTITPAATRPAPVVAAVFDLKNPASWLPWVQAHRDQALKTGLLALGILVVGFGAIRFRARRNSQE
jgi:hypothetical protein